MPTDHVHDHDRGERIGLDEVVFCLSKTPRQIADILARADAEGRRMLLTRLDPEKAAALAAEASIALDYDPASQTGILGAAAAVRPHKGVAIVTAGTSDSQVAREAARTLAYYGLASELFADLGVAGLWRLLDRRDAIAAYPIVIAVAGMEGALFSVLAGLIGSVLIAVPTSHGYGVSAAGRTALQAALGGCAPGVVTVNIDNGYGAACAALRIVNAVAPAEDGGA